MDVPSVETIDGDVWTLDQARNVSQRMFYAGFACLPFLWIVNVWFFWPNFKQGDALIRKTLRNSLIAFGVWAIVFVPWFLSYMVAGERFLSPETYAAFDVTRLNIAAYLG